MGLPIVKNRVTGTAVARAIPAEGVYDTEGLAAAATTQIQFFSNPLGQADASATIARKFYGETNLLTASQLPKGFRMQCMALNLKWFSNLVTGVTLVTADFNKILYGTATGGAGWLEFQISGIVVARKSLSDMPNGVMPIQYLQGATADPGFHAAINNGTEHISNAVRMAVKQQHPTIESGESFGATCNWGVAITTTIAYRFFVIMHGVLMKPL